MLLEMQILTSRAQLVGIGARKIMQLRRSEGAREMGDGTRGRLEQCI